MTILCVFYAIPLPTIYVVTVERAMPINCPTRIGGFPMCWLSPPSVTVSRNAKGMQHLDKASDMTVQKVARRGCSPGGRQNARNAHCAATSHRAATSHKATQRNATQSSTTSGTRFICCPPQKQQPREQERSHGTRFQLVQHSGLEKAQQRRRRRRRQGKDHQLHNGEQHDRTLFVAVVVTAVRVSTVGIERRFSLSLCVCVSRHNNATFPKNGQQ